jgi:hypothetical protein
MPFMRKLTLRLLKNIISISLLGFFAKSHSQTAGQLEEIGYLLGDALFYSEKYLIPATDAAVYQASSSWMISPKRKKVWTATFGLHGNLFFVPKSDRSFAIKNEDFNFFEIENQTTATVPTSIGNDDRVYLIGDLDGEQIRLRTPTGIDQETMFYPYLMAAVELPYGSELVVRYSTRTKLKRGEYQVFGFGLKQNLSQFFPKIEEKNIHFAVMGMYSNADMTFDFLDIDTQYGNLGINRISGLVDTYHIQLSASKEINRFEIITNLIVNRSNFKYKVSGDKGSIEEILPIQDIINELLATIAEPKTNVLGEVSLRYRFSRFYVQNSIAFGKFVNANIGIQYQL